MFDLVMFDLDGTLVDTAPEIRDAVNDTLREVGLAGVSETEVRAWIGQGTAALMAKAYAHVAGLSVEAVCKSGAMDRILPVFSAFYAARCGTRSQPYADVVASLQRLRTMGVRLALVTNKETRFTEAVLRAHNLRRYFDPVVSGDSLEQKKPHPQPVRFCLERHAIPPGRALLVGDSGIDVAAARNAGIACWAVPYGYNQGRPVAADAPDRVIPSISAVCEAIQACPRPSAVPPT